MLCLSDQKRAVVHNSKSLLERCCVASSHFNWQSCSLYRPKTLAATLIIFVCALRGREERKYCVVNNDVTLELSVSFFFFTYVVIQVLTHYQPTLCFLCEVGESENF